MSTAVIDRVVKGAKRLKSQSTVTQPPPVTVRVKTETKKVEPDLVRVSFDRATGTLRVDRNGVVTMQPQIRLRSATFVVLQGRREGCADTGHLGFVDGEAVTFDENRDGFSTICYDGKQFVSQAGATIRAAREVVISGRAMFARI